MLATSVLRMDTTPSFNGKRAISLLRFGNIILSRNSLFRTVHRVCGANFPINAYKSSRRKSRRDRVSKESQTTDEVPLSEAELADRSRVLKEDRFNNGLEMFTNELEQKNHVPLPNRSVVLQACSITSGLLLALGLVLRQASHVAFINGWVQLDTTSEISFSFEPWHLELILGLVVLISTCRYTLLKIWPDFSESSEAANQQVLAALKPSDYALVAFLPGISEELLFRGALLPLVGLNWGSALAVGALFGVLHLGSGRRYSFAVWATFVGFAYGSATLLSSSIVVPMVAHSLNNLVGGIVWLKTSKSSEKESS